MRSLQQVLQIIGYSSNELLHDLCIVHVSSPVLAAGAHPDGLRLVVWSAVLCVLVRGNRGTASGHCEVWSPSVVVFLVSSVMGLSALLMATLCLASIRSGSLHGFSTPLVATKDTVLSRLGIDILMYGIVSVLWYWI